MPDNEGEEHLLTGQSRVEHTGSDVAELRKDMEFGKPMLKHFSIRKYLLQSR